MASTPQSLESAGTLRRSPGHVSFWARAGRTLRKNALWYAFLTPALLMLLLFMAIPLFKSLELAFYEWNGLRPRQYLGLENFQDLFRDRFFWGALQHTVLFAVFATLGTVGIGLLLAVAISRRVPGHGLYRVAFFLPVMLPMTVTAALWVRIYEPTFGLLNASLHTLGLGALAGTWISTPSSALASVITVAVWQFSGFPMVVLLAAIEHIPSELHEAATLDGVNEWQRLRFLTVPLIRPVLISISVIQIIFSLKVFDLVWVMTKGGPGESTTVLGTYLYRKAFELQDYGYASAVAVTMFVVIFSVTYAYYRLMKVDAVEF